MPRTPALLAAATLIALGAGTALAQSVYRWVDRDGGVHYSDLLPPADARSEERKRLDDNVIGTSELPYAVRSAADRYPVTLYSSADCGELCAVGRDLLKRRGIPFSERAVQTKDDAAALMQAIGKAQPMVPSLIVGRQAAEGYQEAIWNALLDAAGYPKLIH